MKKVSLLDCTLRDGGYINNFNFGFDAIKGIVKKIERTGIEFCEVGFIKGNEYDENFSLFPDTNSFKNVISPKSSRMIYVGMLDMSDPVPLERFSKCDGSSIDGIRVIFKKDKTEEAYRYCSILKDLGYLVFVNFVGTDLYTDREFIESIEKFNVLKPFAMSIVDTFGLIKRKQFLRLVYIADNNMNKDIVLCYHGHNNLQQAFGNAEALVELNLNRPICIDACVFGMGRGAGNLNLELFADFMNENYGTQYVIDPMLEIMDEYLKDIYSTRFWGYSLPLYLSATHKCHPNYAIHLANKNSLTVKGFSEILKNMSEVDRVIFNKERSESYYKAYQENLIDDKVAFISLEREFSGRNVVLLAPGESIKDNFEKINSVRKEKNAILISLNFKAAEYDPDFIFSSNMRRYKDIQNNTTAKCIVTSNLKDCTSFDYMVNFSSYSNECSEIIDNSGLMALKLLSKLNVLNVFIAGMDGYSCQTQNYCDVELYYDFSKEADIRNKAIALEFARLKTTLNYQFITSSVYEEKDE